MEPTDEMWSLVKRCWHQKKDLRPTMEAVFSELQMLCLTEPTDAAHQVRSGSPVFVHSIFSAHQAVLDRHVSDLESPLSERIDDLGQVLEQATESEQFLDYMADLRDDDALKMMDIIQTVRIWQGLWIITANDFAVA
jgi:hypothetical protein